VTEAEDTAIIHYKKLSKNHCLCQYGLTSRDWLKLFADCLWPLAGEKCSPAKQGVKASKIHW
jgi:hypothetical protein